MKDIPRRDFIKTTGLGAASIAASGSLFAQAGRPLLKFGVIGCGGYGMLDTRKAFEAGGVECVALCDVDSAQLEKATEQVMERQTRRPRQFKHYPELLEVDDLDFVIIATPPHWHALPFIAACKRRLDIYCEKPLAYDVRESRAMVEAAENYKVKVQIGFQRRSSKLFNEVRDYIQEGNIGRVINVEAKINRQIRLADRTPMDPPLTLDWDLWCGPAPLIPYSQSVGHRTWRYEKTTGNGHLVDWGIHLVDVTRWILGVNAPKFVSAAGGLFELGDHITTPDVMTAYFDFDGVPLNWSHRVWGGGDTDPDTSYGTTFYGEKGTLFATDNRWWSIANEKGATPQVHEVKNNAQLNHMQNFLEALRTGQQPICKPEDGHFSTTAVNLAMIAYYTGRSFKWNSNTEKVIGDPQIAAQVKREYRAPWKHPWAG